MADLVPGQDVSFEDALAQLETLVARLEEGQLPLAEAVEHYERGMGLAAYCTDLLDSAELRIRQVDTATAGDTAPGDEFDLQEQINLLLFEEDDDGDDR
ncbi:MAG TPA: exodeoxyribonuclease VII small subunit [Thermomicrobiales bacterium]|jgi:exodeoxyribonuclease VII small subunit|nr:exodeoxyribonuclease VII small subunit [Thermomicrobiales bacterium]